RKVVRAAVSDGTLETCAAHEEVHLPDLFLGFLWEEGMDLVRDVAVDVSHVAALHGMDVASAKHLAQVNKQADGLVGRHETRTQGSLDHLAAAAADFFLFFFCLAPAFFLVLLQPIFVALQDFLGVVFFVLGLSSLKGDLEISAVSAHGAINRKSSSSSSFK